MTCRQGSVTLAPVNPRDRLTIEQSTGGMVLRGTAHHVPWGGQTDTVLVFARDGDGNGFLALVQSHQVIVNSRRRNVAYEPRAELRFDLASNAGECASRT